MAYNPSLHTASNKSYGVTGLPIDARSYYYDVATFTYRPYASTAEVLSYLVGNQRRGNFSIFINISTTVGSNTTVELTEWWWKDGIADGYLVEKSSGEIDISNFVTKVAGKSLILDSEIIRLAGITSLIDDSETVVPTGGTVNNQVTPTTTLRFTNQSTPVVISGFATPSNGKRIKIYNDTAFNMTFANANASSLAPNRLLNTGNADFYLFPKSTAEFIYSQSKQVWVLTNIWGTDYFPTAILANAPLRVLEVLPTGYSQYVESVQLITPNLVQATAYTKAQLNTQYPNHTYGMMVDCQLINTIYQKSDDALGNWRQWTTAIVS